MTDIEPGVEGLVKLVTQAFEAPSSALLELPPTDLAAFPENGMLHERSIAPFRLLCCTAKLKDLLDCNLITDLEHIVQTKRPGMTPPTTSSTTKANTQMRLAHRAVQELAALRAGMNEKTSLETGHLNDVEEAFYAAEEKRQALLQEAEQIQQRGAQIDYTSALAQKQKEIQAAKSHIEGLGRDLRSVMENVQRLQTQMNQRVREVDMLETKTKTARGELERWQELVVADSDQLTKECLSAQKEMAQSESDLIEALKEDRVYHCLDSALRQFRVCTAAQGRLQGSLDHFSAEAGTYKNEVAQLRSLDERLQDRWRSDLRDLQKTADVLETEEARIAAIDKTLAEQPADEQANAVEVARRLEADARKHVCAREAEKQRLKSLESALATLQACHQQFMVGTDTTRQSLRQWEGQIDSAWNVCNVQWERQRAAIRDNVFNSITQLRQSS